MPIIQRIGKNNERDADGCDYLCTLAPSWTTKENAMDVPNAEEIAAAITKKYGYRLFIGTHGPSRRLEIIEAMKNGTISKEEGVRQLRELARK